MSKAVSNVEVALISCNFKTGILFDTIKWLLEHIFSSKLDSQWVIIFLWTSVKAQNSDIVVKSVKSELNVFIPINKFSILLIQHLTIKFPRKKN